MPFEQALRLVDALPVQRGPIIHLDETHWLARVQAWPERRFASLFVVLQRERRLCSSTRRRRQERVREARFHAVAREARPQARKLIERLSERLGEMHFVEEEQGVVGQEARMHRLHALAHAVALYEHTRSDLIDGGRDYKRLIGRASPAVILRHTAAKREHTEGGFAGAGQRAQPSSDLGHDSTCICRQRAQELATALGNLVDDDTAIYDHRDATWAPSLCFLVRRVESECEESNVDACRFPCAGRQVEHTRPCLVSNDLLKQALLPHEGPFAAVHSGVKGAKVRGGGRHCSETGRQSPRPK